MNLRNYHDAKPLNEKYNTISAKMNVRLEYDKIGIYMNVRIEPTWKAVLDDVFTSETWEETSAFIKDEYLNNTVYPPPKLIFNAFEQCTFDAVKVVILGQDPYHGSGQAHGLCFSVPEAVRIPPSLKNIYKEIEADIGTPIPETGNLERWAQQGVLLLNATLTVRKGQPGSHQGKGWEEFTDAVIKKINNNKEHIVFMLWGNYAKNKGVCINREKHLVLEAAHPSPYSANNGFFGCKHFSQANSYLKKNSQIPIVW
jgi:uracil-DNA glycosylase